MTTTLSPDQIIEEIGGCGRFQMRMSIVAHVMKTLVCFSAVSMVLVSQTPDWWCEDESKYSNVSSCVQYENGTQQLVCSLRSCSVNGSICNNFRFGKKVYIIEEVMLS
jgi:hypothetical protein